MKHSRVCMVGVFPPPVHGMSLVNEYIKKQISLKSTPLVINYSPCTLDRAFMVRFGKGFRVIWRALQLLAYIVTGRVSNVYQGLSGGYGLIYDALFAFNSRVFRKKLYLHHHSYQYLNRHFWLAWLAFTIAGKKATHIVACEKMACDLRRLYPVVKEIKIISGIAALELWNDEVLHREQIRSIGFLSNISIEKGIMEFLDVAAWADQAKLPIQFLIAGPFQDEEIKKLVEERMAAISNVTCIGAVYGNAKQAFFDSIDVFLMPSHNESEGLVAHEAMSRGVPVIAKSLGCLEKIISDNVGLRLDPLDDYVAGAILKIIKWQSNPYTLKLASQTSLKQFKEARALQIKNMDALCAELVGQH